MKIVIDSNKIFSNLIANGEITKLILNPQIEILAPEFLKEEFIKNKKEILNKSKLSERDFNKLSNLIFGIINFIPLIEYQKYLPQAKKLLSSHSKDEDFIALCLKENSKLWTYEKLLFEIGFGISTKEISQSLNLTVEALLSEKVLAKEWLSDEDEKAWKDLK